MQIILSGFSLWLSLMVSIGPQNIFVLKSGIRREYVGIVVLTCVLSDLLFLFTGTIGVASLINHFPIALTILKVLGICYLLYFSFSSFREAMHPQGISTPSLIDAPSHTSSLSSAPRGSVATQTRTKVPTRTRARQAILSCLAITWLNPLAIVDTIMFGSIAHQHGNAFLFAAGAFIATCVWFPLLGFASHSLSRPLSSPRVWRYLNIGIGLFMFYVIARLLMH